MKSLLIGLVLITLSQTSQAFERPFRVDRFYPTVNGYAIAWGVPGVSYDFEKLDTLSDEEIERELDIPSVKNFIVDLQTNEILTTIGEDEFVVFNVGNRHYGNHYGLSLNNLAIQGLAYDVDAIAVVENYKWSSRVGRILLVDRNNVKPQTKEINGSDVMDVLKNKLRLSITAANMELFDTASETIYKIEKKYLENVGDVNVMTFNYEVPKQGDSTLEVIATVKMKYENGKVVPYVLSVKQKQYN